MRGRWRLLGRWWFLGSVAVLALNDHVLKARFPGWWTGKLSDFVGPVVVATLLAVFTGRTAAVVATACGFVALKTIPGVAELAAPFLGGVTRRDATDVIGLLALIPAWHLMRRDQLIGQVRGVPALIDRRPEASSTVRRRALAVLGAAAALLVTTATSQVEAPSVRELRLVDTTLYAVYDSAYNSDQSWAASHDGGLTWTASDGPDVQAQGVVESEAEACRTDGWCYQITPAAVLERPPGGVWSTSFWFSQTERDMVEYRSHGEVIVGFGSVIVAPKGGVEHVVVTMREQGVVVLDSHDEWHRVGVLDAVPVDTSGILWPMRLAERLLVVSAVMAAIAILLCSSRTASGLSVWRHGLRMTALLIISGTLMLGALITLAMGYFNRDEPWVVGSISLVFMASAVGVPFLLTSKDRRPPEAPLGPDDAEPARQARRSGRGR